MIDILGAIIGLVLCVLLASAAIYILVTLGPIGWLCLVAYIYVAAGFRRRLR